MTSDNLLRQTIIGPTGSHVGPASDCRHAINRRPCNPSESVDQGDSKPLAQGSDCGLWSGQLGSARALINGKSTTTAALCGLSGNPRRPKADWFAAPNATHGC